MTEQERLHHIITNADVIRWSVYGLDVRRNGTTTFENNADITWPELEVIAKAIGFEVWPMVHTIARPV